MLYYRVKPEADQRYKNPAIHNGNIYIKNELYTPREVEKHHLNMRYLEAVNISRKKTYFFFGSRFEMTE